MLPHREIIVKNPDNKVMKGTDPLRENVEYLFEIPDPECEILEFEIPEFEIIEESE